MQWRDLLANWGVNKLQLKLGFLTADFAPQDADREAAWELYIELVTRVATQPLPDGVGVDKQALASLHSLFDTSRDIMKKHGPAAKNFARIGIAVLNQILRPFLTRWHGVFTPDTPLDAATCAEFRRQLEDLRQDMLTYTRILAQIADVEELT